MSTSVEIQILTGFLIKTGLSTKVDDYNIAYKNNLSDFNVHVPLIN